MLIANSFTTTLDHGKLPLLLLIDFDTVRYRFRSMHIPKKLLSIIFVSLIDHPLVILPLIIFYPLTIHLTESFHSNE